MINMLGSSHTVLLQYKALTGFWIDDHDMIDVRYSSICLTVEFGSSFYIVTGLWKL